MTIARTAQLVDWTDEELERRLLDAVSLDVPWRIVEDFSSLVRASGSAEERQAFDLLRRHLDQWGVPYTLHEPEAFISLPESASVRVVADGTIFRAKTPAMSVSTTPDEVEAELLYVPGQSGQSVGDIFAVGVEVDQNAANGKIVLTEGMALPGKVADVTASGAVAAIFINPGERIHEGICTTIWGTPDLESWERQPNIPVLAVNNVDGQRLIELAQQKQKVAVSTSLDTAWRRIPVLVAEIAGSVTPDEFVLLHGHLDSWHVGIGDNATGDATLLEMARVFWQHRDQLNRSLRIAWWSGHSHGRYAGSTWYSDTFAIDLARHCVAQVNCDSPGCRWADTYNELTCMSEAEPFVNTVVKQVTGITPEVERPPRAGDYSFNDIGITSVYMLSSTMSDETRRERGYYAVGGCGGNIEWHTEADTIDIADRDVLLRDMRMYAGSVFRVLNAPLHPFVWTRTVHDFRATLDRYAEAAGDLFGFAPSFEALDALQQSLDRFYAQVPEGSADDVPVRQFNFVQRRLARLLVPVNYSVMRPFFHDPALEVKPLPDLAPALDLRHLTEDTAERGMTLAHLHRGQNRFVWTLQLARETVDAATA